MLAGAAIATGTLIFAYFHLFGVVERLPERRYSRSTGNICVPLRNVLRLYSAQCSGRPLIAGLRLITIFDVVFEEPHGKKSKTRFQAT